MKLKKKVFKYLFRGLLGLLLFLLILYFNLIIYGIRQGVGQLDVTWNAQSFEHFLEKSQYSDSLKQYFEKKIDLIKEIKQYAIDSLGLTDNGNYDRIYDQEDKPILWNISASKPFKFEPYTWSYGPFGTMPYRGYFDSSLAKNLVKELKKKELDVNIYSPSAWSTLGWFRDPVLSNMLYWSEGDLASLIIHEMTHGTIWINGEVSYNENLADFIGDMGAKAYLEDKYGRNSKAYQSFIGEQKDSEKFYAHVLQGAQELEKLYQSFEDSMNIEVKTTQKEAKIREILESLDTVSFSRPDAYEGWRKPDKLPNNAFFMVFRRYRAKQNEFEEQYKKEFPGQLRAYIEYLKEEHPV